MSHFWGRYPCVHDSRFNKRLFLLQKPPKHRGLNLISATVFFIGFFKRKSCDTRKKRVREYHLERKWIDESLVQCKNKA